jgi:hypothetical protein
MVPDSLLLLLLLLLLLSLLLLRHLRRFPNLHLPHWRFWLSTSVQPRSSIANTAQH